MTTSGDLNETIAMPDNAIIIKSQTGSYVDFSLSQQWSDEVGLAIKSGLDTCIIKGNVTFGGSEDIRGECIEGFAAVTVVVYMDDAFEPDECEACDADDLTDVGGGYEFCAYRVEIPCEPMIVECGEPSSAPTGEPTQSPTSGPTTSPSVVPTGSSDSPTNLPSQFPTSLEQPEDGCPENPAVLIGSDGETMYPTMPIEITKQNVTHVHFKVTNTFGNTISSVFTEYNMGNFGETECLEEENVEKDSEVDIEFVGQCMVNAKISIVNVWMTDCSSAASFLDESDNAEVPECCHPGEPCRTVQYTFKLPCECPEVVTNASPTVSPVASTKSGAPVSQSRRDLAEVKNPVSVSTQEIESATNNAASNDNEDHFCVVEDYPCGPKGDKVHVCHYSARDGYKTFCVPEPDSDALRFYPKDYCGPCVGGYVSA